MINKESKIIITGAAGFIGSSFISFLNERGFNNLILVDNLTDGIKIKNISTAKFRRYIDYEDFEVGCSHFLKNADFLIHLGANSKTTDWNGKKMMKDNYDYTIHLIEESIRCGIPLVYASSASVYGDKRDGNLNPLNVYAFSKYALDQYVENFNLPVVGLRFFNVYGAKEGHKKDQASPVYKFWKQLNVNNSKIRLFDIESFRDFVHVDDICEIIYFFMENNKHYGIFDVGTGEACSFEDVAKIIFEQKCKKQKIKTGQDINYSDGIEKIPMPKQLEGNYQYFTQANLKPLREIGCKHKFLNLNEGIEKFIQQYEALYSP